MEANVLQKDEIPELLREYDIDWHGYVPTGGFEWSRHLMGVRIPKLKALRDQILKTNASLNSLHIETDAIFRGAERAKKFIEDVNKFIKDSEAEDHGGRTRDWLDRSPSEIDTIVEVTRKFVETVSKEAYEKDVTFLNALIDFYEKDNEADKLLWGIYLVPVKYRTGVFRKACRVVKDVVADIQVIGNCACRAKSEVMEQYAQSFDELKGVYAKTVEFLKSEKKNLDRYGNEYWKTYDSPSHVRMRESLKQSPMKYAIKVEKIGEEQK